MQRGQCIDSLAALRSRLFSLQPGSAAGSGGMRPEFLITLAQEMEDKQMSRLEDLGTRYLNHTVAPWFDRCGCPRTLSPSSRLRRGSPPNSGPLG